MNRVYVGIGSNLDGPTRQVRDALKALAALPGSRLLRSSSLYRSAPVGPPGQPDYINAVAELETMLAPHALLDRLQAIEAAQGRTRGGARWGPRTLDLDLLLFGAQRTADARLTVPHPQIAQRNFVLGPLVELEPELEVPGMGRARELLRRIGNAGLERLTGHVAEAS